MTSSPLPLVSRPDGESTASRKNFYTVSQIQMDLRTGNVDCGETGVAVGSLASAEVSADIGFTWEQITRILPRAMPFAHNETSSASSTKRMQASTETLYSRAGCSRWEASAQLNCGSLDAGRQ